MFAFLAPIAARLGIKGILILLALAAVAGTVGLVKIQQHQIHVLRLENAAASATYKANVSKYEGVIAANATALATLQASAAKNEEILARLRQSAEHVQLSVSIIKKDIRHAPPADDGPVAPVLRRSLDWMPTEQRPPVGPGPARRDSGEAAPGAAQLRVPAKR